jgi:lactate racemase
MIYLGEASNGIPAWVQRAVVEADFRIGVGMITPHMDAGFSGGAKIILPGVCGAETVNAFHARAVDDPKNPLGDPEAPLRLALEKFVQERIPMDFIVNLILTPQEQVFQCVTGHAIVAHRQGVEYARQVYGLPAPRCYPVVVANCAPYQQDLWQSCKGLWCGDLLTADGGTLVWVTHAPEGYSGHPLLPGYIGSPPEDLKRNLDAGECAEAMSAATGVMIGRMKNRIRIALVSSGLTSADAEVMGLDHFTSVEPAVATAVNRLPPSERPGSVAAIPQAGLILPLRS